MVDNSLVLPNVGRQDSGEYICSATNSLGTSDVTVMLDVESEWRHFNDRGTVVGNVESEMLFALQPSPTPPPFPTTWPCVSGR